jgi:hypothetical protein
VNKKKQKNFDLDVAARTLPQTPGGEQRFFGAFFPKKELLAFSDDSRGVDGRVKPGRDERQF